MKFEFSAGGVVYKKEKGEFLILLAKHSGHHGWVFPKGLIGDHPTTRSNNPEKRKRESKEEAALREVEEEAGVKAEIKKPLTSIVYWYMWERERRKKTVYYFIMKYLSGDITKHDSEMEEVEWFNLQDVKDRLTYPGDKKVWAEAEKILEDLF